MTDVHVDRSIITVADLRHFPVMTIRSGDTRWDAWQLIFVSGMRNLAGPRVREAHRPAHRR
jgi:hypothetical protein